MASIVAKAVGKSVDRGEVLFLLVKHLADIGIKALLHEEVMKIIIIINFPIKFSLSLYNKNDNGSPKNIYIL